MKRPLMKCISLLVVCLIITLFPGMAIGRDVENQAELHEFILVKIVPGKRAEFLEFLKSEYIPLQRQDQHIKRFSYYLEDRGLEWDLIVVITYDDYAEVGKSQHRFNEILKRKYPVELERKDFLSRFQGLVDKHRHMFYHNLPALSK